MNNTVSKGLGVSAMKDKTSLSWDYQFLNANRIADNRYSSTHLCLKYRCCESFSVRRHYKHLRRGNKVKLFLCRYVSGKNDVSFQSKWFGKFSQLFLILAFADDMHFHIRKVLLYFRNVLD